MRKPRKPAVAEIQSDDEISDSEPMDAIDQFHKDVDYDSGKYFRTYTPPV